MGLEPAQPSDINTAPGRSLDQGRPLVFGGNRAPAAAEPHPHTAFGSSTGQDLTMALGGITGHSHQAAPHHPQGSSPASPPCACILLLLLLSHLSIYLLIDRSGTFGVISGVQCLAQAGDMLGVVCPPGPCGAGLGVISVLLSPSVFSHTFLSYDLPIPPLTFSSCYFPLKHHLPK